MSAARNQRLRAERKIKNIISKLTPDQVKQLEAELEGKKANGEK